MFTLLVQQKVINYKMHTKMTNNYNEKKKTITLVFSCEFKNLINVCEKSSLMMELKRWQWY